MMQLNFPAIDPAAQIRDSRNNLSLITPGEQSILNFDPSLR